MKKTLLFENKPGTWRPEATSFEWEKELNIAMIRVAMILYRSQWACFPTSVKSNNVCFYCLGIVQGNSILMEVSFSWNIS